MSRRRHSQLQQTWPALNAWQTTLTQGSVRIGDAERDDALRALGEHFSAGRLTHGEYDERSDTALAARTWSDIAPLFADLPAPGPTPPGRRRPAPVAPPVARRHGPPMLPLLFLALGLGALVGWWAFWMTLAGVWLLTRHRRSTRVAQISGSWRAPRGSWS